MDGNRFFSARMRDALTQQFLVSIIRDTLPINGDRPIASIVAHMISRHPRITTEQISKAIAAGAQQQHFTRSWDGCRLYRGRRRDWLILKRRKPDREIAAEKRELIIKTLAMDLDKSAWIYSAKKGSQKELRRAKTLRKAKRLFAAIERLV